MARRLFKVRFELSPADWHGVSGERLWAAPADEPGTFELQNSPFHATGVSYLDIVAARPAEDSTIFNFERVVRHSGHSTYMIVLDPEDPVTQAWWRRLADMGCTYEGATLDGSAGGYRTLYSVDVPPSADHGKAYEVLAGAERSGVWIFQTGYDARATPSSEDPS
jgi:hypothetical protein